MLWSYARFLLKLGIMFVWHVCYFCIFLSGTIDVASAAGALMVLLLLITPFPRNCVCFLNFVDLHRAIGAWSFFEEVWSCLDHFEMLSTLKKLCFSTVSSPLAFPPWESQVTLLKKLPESECGYMWVQIMRSSPSNSWFPISQIKSAYFVRVKFISEDSSRK